MRCWMMLLWVFVALGGSAQQGGGRQVPRPKLVVGIVIDQMRWDFLYRYQDRYSNGGFKRLVQQGFSNENTLIPFTPTYTAAGHATIYTGSVPAVHGIMGNYWYSRQLGRNVYCTEDSTVQSVGTHTAAGRMSPAKMWTTTIGDELRLATNFRSKVMGIAFKDRGSVIPAGHSGNAAYWFDDVTGGFITSTYYMQQLPKWVVDFNNKKLPDQYLSKNWQTLYPIHTYRQSSGDSMWFEYNLPGGTNSFPHNTATVLGGKYNTFRHTPFANSFTFEMAKAAITNEKLGQQGTTDFLALSFSAPDHIGHTFGPNSIEIEDVYLRLDADIAAFLQYLDRTLGPGQYTVFLTADHGVAHIPAFLQQHKIPAGAFDDSEIKKQLNAYFREQLGIYPAVSQVVNYQVYLNDAVVTTDKRQEVINAAIRQLLNYDFIASAFDLSQLMTAPVPARIREVMANGYNMKLSGDIQFHYKPQWFDGGSKGTSHGVWYNYDAHIPLLWYGWGIRPGKTHREVYMTDIAPTLAALLKIQMPSGSIGQVIEEVLAR